jgi:uncharacterized protein YndB with AHSA1/START domain
MTDPIRKSVTVPLGPHAAFRLFAERMGDWWPGETHSVSARHGARPRAVTVTPRPGGHVTETTPDGRQARWATITAYEPGARLAFDWHVGQRPDEEATQVEVTFTPVETGTRVDLVHDGFARRKETAALAQAGYRGGWAVVLASFVRAGQGALAPVA